MSFPLKIFQQKYARFRIFFWIIFLKALIQIKLKGSMDSSVRDFEYSGFSLNRSGLVQNFGFSGSEFKSKLVPFRPSPHFLKNNHPNLGNFRKFLSLFGSPCSEDWSHLVYGFLFHGIRVDGYWKVPSYTKEGLWIMNYT